jgi:hypothetical protein
MAYPQPCITALIYGGTTVNGVTGKCWFRRVCVEDGKASLHGEGICILGLQSDLKKLFIYNSFHRLLVHGIDENVLITG